MLRQHLHAFGTAPDGRLFRGTRGGMLSESAYGRAWHPARHAALGPGPAATALVRRLYDLRHAALSLWLNATGEPAEVAARAGNSARVLHDTYLHCIDTRQDLVSQRIEDALDAGTRGSRPPQDGEASGYTHRRHHPRPCPPYVRNRFPVPRTAHGRRARPARTTARRHSPPLAFPQVRWHQRRSPPRPGDGRTWPTHTPQNKADGLCNLSFCAEKPVTPSGVTGSDLGFCVAGVGFEPT